MYENHRENRGGSEFQTRFVERDGGIFFELEQPGGSGTVSLSSGPHKSLEEARAAGAKMVREILRARIQAAGIGRRGERPAFDQVLAERAEGLRELAGLPVTPRRPWVPPTLTTVEREEVRQRLEDLVAWRDPADAPALEGEQLCTCGHPDGGHMLGTNACAEAWCRCVEFIAAPAQAVQ